MLEDEIRTVTKPTTVEVDRTKGSRFIGDAAPANSEQAAREFVASVKRREPSATHHCWALRLAIGREHSSDDGEPGGTAGPPILRRIQGADLQDVVVVVTRYYGGTNLGTGGLIRAYSGAARAVLEAAKIVQQPILSQWQLAYPYGLSSPVAQQLAAFDAVTVSSDYGKGVQMVVSIRASLAGDFADAMLDATSGLVVPQPVTTIS